MSPISRKLSLHASALSDDEYQLYTKNLLSIVSVEEEDGVSSQPSPSPNMDDAYYENMNINLRETRAWLRGRYSHIPSLIIDKILKLFSPNLSATDSLSGGAFFAVLRLVVHAENGKEVDRSLAFVQAQVGGSFDFVPPNTDQTIASSSSDSFSHNPFTSTPLPQPPLHPSQRSESSSHSVHNPFVHRTLPTRSEDGNAKLPPLPPRKPPAPPPIPQFSAMTPAPPKHISSHNRFDDRPRSPSKLLSTILSHPLPPTIPPKPAHHVTSTLIKQSLQATKAAQTMKKAEEQLERERFMQVLKSSSTVSGTHVYNQHQYQHQQRRSPSPIMAQGQGRTGWDRIEYAASSTSSGSDERAPPLPKRRTVQKQPSPPLSTSSLEQVALATTYFHPTSAPPSSTATAFSNPEGSRNAHVHAYPNTTSPFHPRSRFQVDSSIPLTSSPEGSPRRTSLDLPSSGGGGTSRGRPPPTHPDRKPHQLQHQYQPSPNSHVRSQSYPHSDPFSGSSLDLKGPTQDELDTNVNESFESIYGTSTNPFPPSSPPTTIHITPSTPSPNRVFRSKSLHQPSPAVPPVLRPRKRPESIQAARASDMGVQVAGSEPPSSPTRQTSLVKPPPRRSSLSVSSTPSSSSSSLNHLNNRPPPSPHRHPQSGLSSSSSLTVTSHSGPRTPASSTTTTTKNEHANSTPISPNPLASLQKTFLQIQPHLDKAKYKAEAGLSKRGFVREGLGHKNSRSGGVDGDGDELEGGLEDGLEGLMGSGVGEKQIKRSRWRDGDRGYDGDSDWTRSEGMDHGLERQYSDEEEENGLEKDNLKWPAGEGWKPL